MSNVLKPIYLNTKGIQAQLQDGAIVNIGGTVSHSFTFNGKGLICEDGSTTTGGTASIGGGAGTLQAVYNNSSDSHGNATIVLQTGKDFIVYDDTNPAIFFKIQSTTGDVTVTGNLTVLGSTTLTNTVEISDHWTLQPSHPTSISLSIEPAVGNIPSADLINVKIVNGGSPVFRVDATGKTILKTLQVSGNVTVVGLINGQDITVMANELNDHLTPSTFPVHNARQIQVIPTIPTLPGINNVQDALQGLATQIAHVTLGNTIARGFEYIQAVPSALWQISHSQNTRRVQFTVYDENGNWILPNSFKIIDQNNVQLGFGTGQMGSAILMMF